MHIRPLPPGDARAGTVGEDGLHGEGILHGCRLIRHALYFILQLAESHLTQRLFGHILSRLERLTWHPT